MAGMPREKMIGNCKHRKTGRRGSGIHELPRKPWVRVSEGLRRRTRKVARDRKVVRLRSVSNQDLPKCEGRGNKGEKKEDLKGRKRRKRGGKIILTIRKLQKEEENQLGFLLVAKTCQKLIRRTEKTSTAGKENGPLSEKGVKSVSRRPKRKGGPAVWARRKSAV